MTERGLPLADGAPACPFVAFEDDRDERSSAPDHRHRCYADQRPAPRALAHQEAYCLSSAFPVCPTFQDWARREAARSRGAAPTAPSASAGMNRAATGATGDTVSAADAAAAAGIAAGAATAGAAAAAGSGTGPSHPSHDDHDPDDRGHDDPDDHDLDDHDRERGRDDRRPADAADSHADDQVRRNPPRDWAAPPPWLASNEARPDDDAEPPAFLGHRSAEPGQGLVGSAADRLAGGPPPRHEDVDEGDWSSESRSAAAVGAGLAAGGSEPRPARRSGQPAESIHDEDERRPARRPRAYSQHLGGPDGPDWERPRRYEAYPAIRSRVGIPAIPRIVLLAALVPILAVALFLLPGILNLGGSNSPAASTEPSGRPGPSASRAPTVAPEPTPVLYTIKKGDVLSKVAAAHGVTLEELLAANPAIKNPNKISEGQQIVIPSPSAAPPDTIDGSAAP